MSSSTTARRGFAARLAITISLAAAVVALTAASAFAATVSIRVEGQQRTLFTGTKTIGAGLVTDTDGGTHWQSGNALWALDAAALSGGFPYEVINNSQWGLYVSSINAEQPIFEPIYSGWSYRVNGAMAQDGASVHTIKNGDRVLWYYGAYDATPAAVAVPSSYVPVNTTAAVTAQWLDVNGVAAPLANATVYVGSRVVTSIENGKARVFCNKVGDWGVRVEKDGYIRSAKSIVHVRYATKSTSLAASSTKVNAGATVKLSAKLYATGGMPAGRKVTLQSRKAGASTWKAVGTKTTDSLGRFHFYVKPYANTYYRATFAGDSAFGAVTSASRLISVR